MTLFETYEPQTEYLQAVVLRPENFDALADELSHWDNGRYLVSKVIRFGSPYALTLTSVAKNSEDSMTCHLFQMFVHRGKSLEVMDRRDVRDGWRLVAADPFR